MPTTKNQKTETRHATADNETVYIVDDDELVRETLKYVFASAGFEVITFDSAEKLLSYPLQTQNACLILDLRMPRMGGLEVQKQLRQRSQQLPIIFYTGNADVSVTVRVMQQGAYTLLEKPLSNELLIENVRNAIESYRRAQSHQQRIAEAKTALSLLTEREREIAQRLANGESGPEIARNLYISARTVDAHRSSIFNKLEINSVAKLVHLVMLSDESGS